MHPWCTGGESGTPPSHVGMGCNEARSHGEEREIAHVIDARSRRGRILRMGNGRSRGRPRHVPPEQRVKTQGRYLTFHTSTIDGSTAA
eukprot:scaffold287_cov337-Pavlova_lutheri.AAC.44